MRHYETVFAAGRFFNARGPNVATRRAREIGELPNQGLAVKVIAMSVSGAERISDDVDCWN
jgi:hypothetical protein